MHTLTPIEMAKRKAQDGPLLFIDAAAEPSILSRAIHSGYSGVLGRPKKMAEIRGELGSRVTSLVDIDPEPDSMSGIEPGGPLVIASKDAGLAAQLRDQGFLTAYRAYVDSQESLHAAIEIGRGHTYLLLSFKDPTNIPLELVIASLQSSGTILVKEIVPGDLDDAVVTLGVMEVGADGILFTPSSHQAFDEFLKKRDVVTERTIPLSEGQVIRAQPVGMGYRSCIDLATLFSPTEGMLVGSTSQGGILCCPEVFHLPYMELRPFRVNAGAVHSYVYNLGNKTDYMTELRAGSPVMVVDRTGRTRRAFVGRMKTEVRPLRLIEVGFKDDSRINILLQDDWHVRVYSDDARPLNITELKAGDRVLAYQADPGRHVGIKVAEHILEN